MQLVNKLGGKDSQMADCHSLWVFELTAQRCYDISNSSEIFFLHYRLTLGFDSLQ